MAHLSHAELVKYIIHLANEVSLRDLPYPDAKTSPTPPLEQVTQAGRDAAIAAS